MCRDERSVITVRGTGRQRQRLVAARVALLLGALAVLLAGCGGEGDTASQGPAGDVESQAVPQSEGSAQTSGGTQVSAEEIPPAVAATRDAITAAASERDYKALAALLDPAKFSYSLGESGDPIGYWRQLEAEETPIVSTVLPTVLSMRAAKVDDMYVWPAANAKDPATWTADDLADRRLLYSDDDIQSFQELGAYLGYRVGIREDGTWHFFVAGD
jgi:hypothetical protein